MSEPDQSSLAAAILDTLAGRSLSGGEVLFKQGRSRRCEKGPQGQVVSSSQEQGWAIRATNSRASVCFSGTGVPSPASRWPEPDGQSLQLPPCEASDDWQPPADLDASLMSEAESIGMLAGIERELTRELPGARILRAHLEEGTSETTIFSSTGIAVGYRSRAASLHVHALGPWAGSGAAMMLLAEREMRRFQPVAIAKRLANRLLLEHEGAAPSRERGDVLLSPAIGIRLLDGLRPLLIGRSAEGLVGGLQDPQGRLGSRSLTIIDNGRLAGGVLEAPVDGEGVPTGEVVLIEEGVYRQPLLGWDQLPDVHPERARLAGHRRRESWQDLPRLGPSHLYIRPEGSVPVSSLLSTIARGHYLVEPLGAARYDFQADRFQLRVCGFTVQQGVATAPLSGVFLEGSISSLLRGIKAVARDLLFEPLGGMIGSPTLLVAGLGIRSADA